MSRRLIPHAEGVALDPEALEGSPEALVDRVCRALRDLDAVPIDRASWSLPTLDPEVRSFQIRWTPEDGARAMTRTYADADLLARSPLRRLYDGETEVRCRLLDAAPAVYDIEDDLRAQGFTDYIALAAPRLSPLERAPMTFATRAADGFSEGQLAVLRDTVTLASLPFSVHAHRVRTRGLLATYLGRDAASRVLDGHIRRGDVVALDAAVCFCDLRGFTERSQQLSPDALLGLLHDTFGAVVGAVEAAGGDVLKFIGDAVLAVFVDADGGRAAAVARARAAADAALRALESVNAARADHGDPAIAVGISIHVGPVTYGNIGGERRLDFTVIGPTVNLAARLEGLCAPLGARLVLSEEAASWLPEALRGAPQGPFPLKGIAAPQRVWAVR